MNILFIEDEKELLEAAVAQLELRGYTVYPAADIATAREVMLNPSTPVHLILADYNLSDGFGIDFVIEMKAQFPESLYAIVSGCLTDKNVSYLEEQGIPYFRKPLLYGKVVEELRRDHLMHVPSPVEPAVEEPIPEEPVPQDEPTEVEEATVAEPDVLPKKKWFGLFGSKGAQG